MADTLKRERGRDMVVVVCGRAGVLAQAQRVLERTRCRLLRSAALA